MAHWRSVEDYSPFARILVEYMWAQRPPLLPAQFAARMGTRKQALSSWLTSDATPPPQVVVRLARAMGLPVADLLIAAGHATLEDPLVDSAGAWEVVLATVRAALERASSASSAQELAFLPADQDIMERMLTWMSSLRASNVRSIPGATMCNACDAPNDCAAVNPDTTTDATDATTPEV